MRFGKFKRNQRGALVLIGLIVLSLVVLTYLTDYLRATQAMPYTTFLKQVEAGAVKSAYLDGDELRGQLHDGSRYQTVVVHDAALVAALQNHNVSLESVPASNQAMPWYMILLFIIIAVGVVAWVLLRQTRSGGSGGGNSPFGVGKSKAKMFMPSQIKITFDDVAGAQEAKEELRDLVDFLKFPEKYEKLGARLTKGVLLVGEPGNGKTLLAKAVAGEAHCPFFSVSGSDFIEVFVGVGAARVRDLFAQARKHAPAIIFIDEIDAVGRQRGGTFGGSHEERDQTLNQLLTEMDGFESDNAAVVVIAATNRPDVLDKALLRPGRFDKRVEVPYPDLASREQILQVHTRNVRMAAGIDLYKVARATPGFSGADLAQLINEAAIAAAKRNSRAVELKDLEEARDRMMLGKQTGSIIMSEKERKVTAYHEAGHALVTLLLPEVTDPLHKVTIIPRGRALGVTHSLPERDRYSRSKDEMLATITMALGGRAAEQLIFNVLEVGAASDFQKATQVARAMVCSYGMSDKVGCVALPAEHYASEVSQATAALIDSEIKRILDESLERALHLIGAHRDKLELLAQALLEKETLYADEIYELLAITPRETHRLE